MYFSTTITTTRLTKHYYYYNFHSYFMSIPAVKKSVFSLWANSTDDKLMTFFAFSPKKNRPWHSMQIVYLETFAWSMECQSLLSGENKEKYFKMLSVEFFTQHESIYKPPNPYQELKEAEVYFQDLSISKLLGFFCFIFCLTKKRSPNTVDSRYLNLAYLE